MSLRNGTFAAVFLLGCIKSATSIPIAKCKNGLGLKDPTQPPDGYPDTPEYGNAVCLRCSDSKCGNCYKYYKSCLECLPGYGFDSKRKCVPCKSPTCGMCPKSPSKCTVQQSKCEEGPVTTFQDGAKKKAWNGANSYCNAYPGLQGNGYSRNLTAAITNGVCYNCASEDFLYYIEDLTYCDFLAVARSVAITPFKTAAAKAACPFPSAAVPVVTKACYEQAGNYPFGNFPFYFVFKVKFCGKIKEVYVGGGWTVTMVEGQITRNVWPAKKWTWMVKN